MAYLEIRQLGKHYLHRQGRTIEPTVALQDVSFNVERGQFCCVVGPSGCGKSTLLRILAGLLRPDSGQALLAGEEIRGPGLNRAMVFQHFNLLPWRTALANVEFGLEVRKMTAQTRHEQARRYLTLVGLAGFEGYYPTQLSGGMQQRVGLARALAIEPEVLLMDEPFGSLDAQTREALQVELTRLWALEQRTAVFVTHDIEEALFLADQILVMSPRPGTIRAVFPVDFARPRQDALRSSPDFAAARGQVAALLKGNGPA